MLMTDKKYAGSLSESLPRRVTPRSPLWARKHNDFFLQNEFTNLIVNGVNPSGNDNVFWWSFDNQLGQSWEPRDSSTIPNSDIEPPNGNAFHLMMQTEDFGIQQVTSSTVSEFYSNSNQ